MARFMGLILGILLAGAQGLDAGESPFPDIAGWKASGTVQTFAPGNLYEYINGAADLYLACDFEELKVAEYAGEGKASVTVEVYRHRTPEDAFGIYSQERLSGSFLIAVGAQGYADKDILNFLNGRYYVKISGYNTGRTDREVLQAFAGGVAGMLGKREALPALLSAFPAQGKVDNSERYISRNFLGYPFFNAAFTADYELSGRKFKLFLIEAKDRGEAGGILERYLRQLKAPEQRVGEGRHTVQDPHHGVIDLLWRGTYIWGTYDLADGDLRTRYLNLLEGGLGKGR